MSATQNLTSHYVGTACNIDGEKFVKSYKNLAIFHSQERRLQMSLTKFIDKNHDGIIDKIKAVISYHYPPAIRYPNLEGRDFICKMKNGFLKFSKGKGFRQHLSPTQQRILLFLEQKTKPTAKEKIQYAKNVLRTAKHSR